MPNSPLQSRRTFLRMMGGLTAGLAVSSSTLAKIPAVKAGPRKVSFYNLHTGESLQTCSGENGMFSNQCLSAVNHLLRDHRTDEEIDIDTQLLTLLGDLKQLLGTSRPFHVISGYRSPKTNSMLSQKSGGVAKKSLHMQGKAIDIRIPGMDISQLHKGAKALKAGGVGLYSRSNFVHVDVGRVRYWGS
jgi:uncharacterized protein YcbK (DUF882 family)